jgi:hypothetical protein
MMVSRSCAWTVGLWLTAGAWLAQTARAGTVLVTPEQVRSTATRGKTSSRLVGAIRPTQKRQLLQPVVLKEEVAPVRDATIVSWNVRETRTPLPDPWQISLDGFPAGERVVLATQLPSAKIKLDPNRPVTAEELQAALQDALRFQQFHVIESVTPGERRHDAFGWLEPIAPSQKTVEEVLPVHAPVKVVASLGGEQLATLLRNVKGLPTRLISTRIEGRTRVETEIGGLFQQHYKPWAADHNLWLTPALEEKEALMLGLAALSIGAKVRITNLDMLGRGEGNHTVEPTPDELGSFAQAIPAPVPGMHYRMTISYPGVANAAHPQELVFEFQLPESAPEGAPYQPVRLVKTN